MSTDTAIRQRTRTKPPCPDNSWVVEQLLQNPVLIIREMNNRSFFEFFKYFWPVVSSEELVLNWHMEYLCNELQEAIENLALDLPKLYDILINIPPGTTKTTIVSVMLPAWAWTRWFWMKFITASYGATLSLESSEKCRDLIRSAEFRAIYPEIGIKEDKDTKGNYAIVKRDLSREDRRSQEIVGGGRFATSVDGTVTGFHAHVIIWDDPLNPKDANSKVMLARTNRWISETISTRKVDKQKSFTIGIMQRICQNDPSGFLLKKSKSNLHYICLPGELDNFADLVHPPKLKKYYVDGLLDPRRLNRAVLQELQTDLGQYGYAGQIGQKPTPPGGGMFKIDMFQIIDTAPSPDEFVKVVRYWDKAGSQGAGCYTAGTKMAKLRDGRFLILNVRRGQWGTNIRENHISATADADYLSMNMCSVGTRVRTYVEQEPGSGGKESAEATCRRLSLAGYHCEADLPRGDKVFRADPYSVQVNMGNVYLLQGDWNQAFVEEHEYFPVGTYKDQVDSAAGAYSKLVGKRQVIVR
jgi:predicted phage terminase large subunit-like protein